MAAAPDDKPDPFNRLEGDLPFTDFDAALAMNESSHSGVSGRFKLFDETWEIRSDYDGHFFLRYLAGHVRSSELVAWALTEFPVDEQLEDWTEACKDHGRELTWREWRSVGEAIVNIWMGVPLELSASADSGSADSTDSPDDSGFNPDNPTPPS